MAIHDISKAVETACLRCGALVKECWKHCPSCGEAQSGSRTPSQRSDPLASDEMPMVSLDENKGKKSESDGSPRLAERYEIRERIGRGGMGVVYLARDKRLDRLVAVKRTLKADDRGIRRFVREARSAARLNHQNIVTVYDAGEDDEGPWITMEFIPGGLTLKDRVEDTGPLSVDEVASIGVSICRALAYAHRAGLIHRDVKPGNVLFTREGVSKLSDFGLVRESEESDISMTGFGMGTKDYAAPEQLKDAKSVDHRADIYGLGAMLYFLLTGESPRTIRSDSIPVQLREIVLKAVAERPEDRFFSADEMRKTLEFPGSAVFSSIQQTKVSRSDFHCPQCNTINPKERKYCLSCGEGLCVVCPKCEGEEVHGVQFCGSCGIDIPAWIKSEEHLAAAQKQMGRHAFKGAAQEAESVLKAFPNRNEAKLLLDEANKKLAAIRELRGKAHSLEKDGRFEDVEKVWRRLQLLVPDDREAIRALADLPNKIRRLDFEKTAARIRQQIKEKNWPAAKKTIKRMRQLAGKEEKESVSVMVRTLRDALLADLYKRFESDLAACDFESCSSLLSEMEKLGDNVKKRGKSLQKAMDAFDASEQAEQRSRRRRLLCLLTVMVTFAASGWFGYKDKEKVISWLQGVAPLLFGQSEAEPVGGEDDVLQSSGTPVIPDSDSSSDPAGIDVVEEGDGDPVPPDEDPSAADPGRIVDTWLAGLDGSSPGFETANSDTPSRKLLHAVSAFVDEIRNEKRGLGFVRVETALGTGEPSAFVRTLCVYKHEPVTRIEATGPRWFRDEGRVMQFLDELNAELHQRCREIFPYRSLDLGACFGFRLTTPEEHRAVFNEEAAGSLEILMKDVKGEGYEWLGAAVGGEYLPRLYTVFLSRSDEDLNYSLKSCEENESQFRRLRYTFYVDRDKVVQEFFDFQVGDEK